ncbi:MAG TPA: L-threonylcarbamoyladenylate synthase [Candidatus Saccharimonadales bacterium]|nr:L-threonylcarbamoyladenylate synthase [Candidatus Saccharimonadales bacterium]
MPKSSVDIIEILKNGGVGVMATDTIYGLVGSAFSPNAVERIYQLKGRRADKPFIILIASPRYLKLFDIHLDKNLSAQLKQFWPGPVSLVLPCPQDKFAYLHRGGQSLAFRVPAKPALRRLLASTGPLTAPSANPEGSPPAGNITEAKQYFDDQVDFYRAGQVGGSASKVIRLSQDGLEVLRP